MKSKYYHEFTREEIVKGYNFMCNELKVLQDDSPILELFAETWIDFQKGKFSYDGATFCKERSTATIFEVAAFNHDRRNYLGFVGKEIDREMFAIMIALNYEQELIFERYLLTRLTKINVIRHILLNNYKHELPTNLYIK